MGFVCKFCFSSLMLLPLSSLLFPSFFNLNVYISWVSQILFNKGGHVIQVWKDFIPKIGLIYAKDTK